MNRGINLSAALKNASENVFGVEAEVDIGTQGHIGANTCVIPSLFAGIAEVARCRMACGREGIIALELAECVSFASCLCGICPKPGLLKILSGSSVSSDSQRTLKSRPCARPDLSMPRRNCFNGKAALVSPIRGRGPKPPRHGRSRSVRAKHRGRQWGRRGSAECEDVCRSGSPPA